MKIETHDFRPMDLVSGEPVLDFVNTVTGRDVAGRDWLPDFDAVVRWARLADAWPSAEIDAFQAAAAVDPEAAVEAVVRLKALREALFAVLYVRCKGLAPGQDDQTQMTVLEAAWREGRKASRLGFADDGRMRVRISAWDGGVDWLRYDLAARAVDLLQAADPERLKVCLGENCAWLFVDRSKAGKRRWCDMKTCGNAAKTRRHSEFRRIKRGQ